MHVWNCASYMGCVFVCFRMHGALSDGEPHGSYIWNSLDCMHLLPPRRNTHQQRQKSQGQHSHIHSPQAGREAVTLQSPAPQANRHLTSSPSRNGTLPGVHPCGQLQPFRAATCNGHLTVTDMLRLQASQLAGNEESSRAPHMLDAAVMHTPYHLLADHTAEQS